MMNYVIMALLVWVLAWPAGAQAAAVGKFTKVEGQVDLLKKGKLPAIPVKPQDSVEPGDVIRTKSGGRAQITFVDDTTMSLSPGSRVAIESYMYDAAKKQRNGVVQVFYGMVYTVVNRILQTEKADIHLKTHTAIMGVRGTKWYAVLHPIATDIFNESGKVCAHNAFAEVTGEVCLKDRQFTRVAWNMPPTIPTIVSRDDFLLLQRQLSTGLSGSLPGAVAPPGGGPMSALPQPGIIPTPGVAETVIGAPVPPASTLPVLQVTPQLPTPTQPTQPSEPFHPPR
ncbi:MAG: FecR domain-containing protein [Thermodesulfobacteriota bacterium]